MLASIARLVLFGRDTYDMRKKPTPQGWAWGKLQNWLRRRLGLHDVSSPGVVDFLNHYAGDWLQSRGMAPGDELPAGWPKRVYAVLERYVKARGGSVVVGDLQIPAFTLERRSALVLPSMWVVYVRFESPEADLGRLERAEDALEDAIARDAGEILNLRVLSKPARIEIDNPRPPIIRLADSWSTWLQAEPLLYAVGVQSTRDGEIMQANRLSSPNSFSMAWFGASGSGKTQAMLAALLTVCATTSPADLAIVVVDPKALDFPVDALPHLACPVITDADEAREVILAFVDEMDRRVRDRDREAAQRRVLIVIDELADLLAQQVGSELTQALQRLGQKGRAWGFSMFVGSQRAVNDFFPKSVHSQIPARWVGRVRDGSEAAFASGASKCDAHKLPGKGAAMIYAPDVDGARVQSLFVAASEAADYEEQVGVFVGEIAQKWDGVAPCMVMRAAEPDVDEEPGDLSEAPGDLDDLIALYREDPERFSRNRIRQTRRVSGSKAGELYDAVMALVGGPATEFAGVN